MDINVIRLRTVLDDREKSLIKENSDFIEEINTELMEEDIVLKEGAKEGIATIYFIETGGSETQFLKFFDELDPKEPILLMSNCKNNSLPATFEIKTYISRHHKTAIMFASLDANIVARHIKGFFHLYLAKKSIENDNLGLIGEPSPWLISSSISSELLKEKCQINLIKISMEELIKEINKKKMANVPHLAELKKKWDNEEVLTGALYFYSAIKRLIEKYHLKGLTIRCFDLLKKYHNTACLALAILNEEGYTCACEGDISSLLTMHMLKAITSTPSFMANPSYIKAEKAEVLFAHCTVPLNMTNDYELLTHFESNEGIGIRGKMPLGEVSVCKISITNKGFFDETLAISGTIKDNLTLKDYCRTQIAIEFNEPDLISFFKTDFANHCIITYGNVVEDFLGLLSLYQMAFDNE